MTDQQATGNVSLISQQYESGKNKAAERKNGPFICSAKDTVGLCPPPPTATRLRGRPLPLPFSPEVNS